MFYNWSQTQFEATIVNMCLSVAASYDKLFTIQRTYFVILSCLFKIPFTLFWTLKALSCEISSCFSETRAVTAVKK